jgi:GT2 family glycosyltransferase
MSLRVNVIIISYRSSGDIKGCLDALARSAYADFAVYVCENAGKAAFEQTRAALPSRLASGQSVEIYLAPGNLGYGGGINYVLDLAPAADAYWILNPDTVPDPQALGAMVARLEQGDCDAVGHDLVLSDGNLASRAGGVWNGWTARPHSISHGQPRTGPVDAEALERRINYVIGASMLVSAEFIKRAGRVREDYFLYCEETEWCLRGLRRGARLGYASEAVVVHLHGTTTGAGGALSGRSKLAIFLNERNRLLVTRDLFPGRLPVTAAIAFAHVLLRYGKSRAWRQIGYGLEGWLAGLRNQRGRPAFAPE